MDDWHTMTRAMTILAALAALGCSSVHGAGADCPDDAAFACRTPTAPGNTCCYDDPVAGACVDGAWTCPSDRISAALCTGTAGETCPTVGPPPPPVDAGAPPPPPLDGGTTDCTGLGPAACFADLDCAPLFDDQCCPSCSPGPCADCFDPAYVECVPFDGCRTPACGVVPSWGCVPTAPDCADATPTSVDGCSAYGCVPGYPPGEGDPSIADAICVPITGDSCTTACRRLPPTCPSGTVPEGDGSCYTDRCIPAFVCE